MSRIRFLVMDVDGTLTDGKIYMGANGELMKAFNIKDGCGIHDLLPRAEILPLIITGRKSTIVENRCKEIGIKHYYQGVSNKVEQLKKFLAENNGSLNEVAYAGDDINDLSCMQLIKEGGGLLGAPYNACQQVKDIADFVSSHLGGEGAIRDFVEYLVFYNKKQSFFNGLLDNRCLEAVKYLSELNGKDLPAGRYEVNEFFFYTVQEYETKDNPSKHFESHRKYVDVQLLVSGEENLQIADINRLQIETPYDEDKERILYNPTNYSASVLLRPGSCVVLYPKDAHRTIAIKGSPCKVKKIVGKVLINNK